MKKSMAVALLAAAFAIPGALIAAETQRFAPVDPKAYSPAQQEFAKLMTVGPRAGTVAWHINPEQFAGKALYGCGNVRSSPSVRRTGAR